MYIRRADGGLRYYDAQQFVVITSDPSQAYVRGIEVESGKEDTTQLTIAALMARRINVPTDLLDID